MKITTNMNSGGYSAQLIQAGQVLRMGGRSLAVFLHNAAGKNPSLLFTAPPSLLLETAESNIRTVLHEQIFESSTPLTLRPLLTILIENIDDNGMLEWSDAMQAELTENYGAEKLQNAITALQNMSSPGIGGRDLAECLLLQLAHLPNSAAVRAAVNIVKHRMHWFLRRRFDKLSQQNLAAAIDILESLTNHPGASLNTQIAAAALPDVEFAKVRGLWKAHPSAANWNPTAVKSSSGNYWRARQLVAAVSSRRRKLLDLAQLAADRQSVFFTDGAAALRPFPMQEAAAALGVTSGMISHIVADKYFLANGEMLALKSLFARQTPNGTAAAAATQYIKTIVAREDSSHPISDSVLQQQLRHQGIVLARRTVGKYRTAAGILRASMRKRPPA
ncbi:MAG: hypothetical protein ACNYPH_08325 [Gammaproteobacteria bacterium WSBS_2016_MAG_OTU1]